MRAMRATDLGHLHAIQKEKVIFFIACQVSGRGVGKSGFMHKTQNSRWKNGPLLSLWKESICNNYQSDYPHTMLLCDIWELLHFLNQ